MLNLDLCKHNLKIWATLTKPSDTIFRYTPAKANIDPPKRLHSANGLEALVGYETPLQVEAFELLQLSQRLKTRIRHRCTPIRNKVPDGREVDGDGGKFRIVEPPDEHSARFRIDGLNLFDRLNLYQFGRIESRRLWFLFHTRWAA